MILEQIDLQREQPKLERGASDRPPTFAAVVTDIRLRDRAPGRARWQVALDRTEFQTGDVGEIEAVAARSGARLVVPVVGVEVDAEGQIWHVVEKPVATGTAVTGAVESRSGGMESRCGEVESRSADMERLCGGVGSEVAEVDSE